MYPEVYANTIYSCKQRFGLPSWKALESMSLFIYLVIDYAMYCQELNAKRIVTQEDINVSVVKIDKKIITCKFVTVVSVVSILCLINGEMRVVNGINTYN